MSNARSIADEFSKVTAITTTSQLTAALAGKANFTSNTFTAPQTITVNSAGYFGSTLQQLLINNTSTANAGSAISLQTTAGATFDIVQFGSGASPAGAAVLNNRNAAPMMFFTNNTEAMRIDSSGNIAIANTNPIGKLSVNLASATSNGTPGNISLWDTTYAIFGTANSGSGAALGIGFDTVNGGVLTVLAPNVAWKPMNYVAASHTFYIANGILAASINSSGALIAKISKRTTTTTDASSITANVDTTDLYTVTGLTQTLTLANPTGTPSNGQQLMFRIKDNGTARTLAYGTNFRASADLSLPTLTVASKTLYLGFIYNSTDTKWDLIAALGNF